MKTLTNPFFIKIEKGALRAFSENKNINIAAIETANWSISEGYSVSKNILNTNPDIKAIFCANDMMVLGVIQYLDEIKRTDILISGYDALLE